MLSNGYILIRFNFYNSITSRTAIIAIFLLRSNEVEGQNNEVKEKQDIFKVIMAVNGVDHKGGDVITLATVNGLTKSKLFDETKTYLSPLSTEKPTIIEYTSTFSNMTVKTDSEFKACTTCQELKVNLSYRGEFSCVQTSFNSVFQLSVNSCNMDYRCYNT